MVKYVFVILTTLQYITYKEYFNTSMGLYGYLDNFKCSVTHKEHWLLIVSVSGAYERQSHKRESNTSYM